MCSSDPNKEKSPLINPRTEKAIGVDLRAPRLGFPRIQTTGASEALENLHVSLTYIYRSVMEGWYVAYIGPPRDVVHRYGLTVGKMVDLYVETPGTCLPEPILRYSRPNLCFSMYICTKQTKRKKKFIGQPSYEESYRGRSTGPTI